MVAARCRCVNFQTKTSLGRRHLVGVDRKSFCHSHIAAKSEESRARRAFVPAINVRKLCERISCCFLPAYLFFFLILFTPNSLQVLLLLCSALSRILFVNNPARCRIVARTSEGVSERERERDAKLAALLIFLRKRVATLTGQVQTNRLLLSPSLFPHMFSRSKRTLSL